MGCEAALGELIVIISGHCIPMDNKWLKVLCEPLRNGMASYAYGRQIAGPNSRYSEYRIFAKHYPWRTQIPQNGFFCNNANSAIMRSAWKRFRFDEDLTGLEDMDLARRLINDGGKVAYIAEACVHHFHDEAWRSVKRRFEREAIALQKIMPQIHIHKPDLARYIISSIWLDWRSAKKDGVFFNKAIEIVFYRFYQYWGSYVGNHEHRKLSHSQKEQYFYPDGLRNKHEEENHSAATYES